MLIKFRIKKAILNIVTNDDTTTQDKLDNGITLNSTTIVQNCEWVGSAYQCGQARAGQDSYTTTVQILDQDGSVLATVNQTRNNDSGYGANAYKYEDTVTYAGAGSNQFYWEWEGVDEGSYVNLGGPNLLGAKLTMTYNNIVIPEETIEEIYEVIEEFVEELETEELVVVVEQIAEVGVENLAVADEQTIKVVQAVVAEVVDTETVEELSEEEVEAVAEVLGFEEEEDVAIIAEVAAKDETVAEAVSEYVERAVDNADTENYTLADVVTEVQVEVFLENPVGTLLDVNIGEMDLGAIGSDMTSDQKEKAQEVVVPIIIASQIVAQAGALITRRF